MEDSLLVLKEGRSAHVSYETEFLIEWPQHLGGGEARLELEGSMVLIPTMASD